MANRMVHIFDYGFLFSPVQQCKQRWCKVVAIVRPEQGIVLLGDAEYIAIVTDPFDMKSFSYMCFFALRSLGKGYLYNSYRRNQLAFMRICSLFIRQK